MCLWSCSHLIQACTHLKNALELFSLTRACAVTDTEILKKEDAGNTPLSSRVVTRCLTISENQACSFPFLKPIISSLRFLAPEVLPTFPAARVLIAVGPHQQLPFRPRFSPLGLQAYLTVPLLQSSCNRSFYCMKTHS